MEPVASLTTNVPPGLYEEIRPLRCTSSLVQEPSSRFSKVSIDVTGISDGLPPGRLRMVTWFSPGVNTEADSSRPPAVLLALIPRIRTLQPSSDLKSLVAGNSMTYTRHV